MQNKRNHCGRRQNGRSDFGTLDGSWGRINWNCDGCASTTGCGALVRTNASGRRNGCDGDWENRWDTRQRDTGCECERQTRSEDCDCDWNTCGSRSQKVECCEDNTDIRSFPCDRDNGCGARQNRSNGCERSERRERDRCDECDRCDACDRCDERDRCDDSDERGRNDKDNPRLCKNEGVGMVWAVDQELDRVFTSDSALCSGTLFPELHKPMNGYCPGECNCQTCEQAKAFAAWEMRLYLDTHPCDRQALALFRRLREEAEEPNYATTFLDEMDCRSTWDWTDDPWPWECRPCGK